MCGRYVTGSDELSWREWVEILRPGGPPPDPGSPGAPPSEPPPERPVQPGSDVVAWVPRSRSEARAWPGAKLVDAKWGFVMPSSTGLYFNLRSETAPKRFASALRDGRAALPALSFEVASGEAGQKKRPRFRVRSDGALLLAALCVEDPSVPTGRRVSVLTRASRGELAGLHDREPVLVPRDLLLSWLSPGEGADALAALLERPDPVLQLEPVVREASATRKKP